MKNFKNIRMMMITFNNIINYINNIAIINGYFNSSGLWP